MIHLLNGSTEQEAHLFFIDDDEEHVGIGFTEVISIELEKGEEDEIN